MIIPMLAISYLPDGVTREQTLLVFDIGLLGLLTLNHWRLNGPVADRQSESHRR